MIDDFVAVEVKILNNNARIPMYAKQGDSGFDFILVDDLEFKPKCVTLVPTGLAFKIPSGYEMQLRMRSGASIKYPLIIANSPGTIDSGYRGEVKLIVRNLSDMIICLKKGDRIAQGIISPVVKAVFVQVKYLDESERGSQGFGSTGGI